MKKSKFESVHEHDQLRARSNRLNAELDTIIQELPTRSLIFLPTERVPLEEKVKGLMRVRDIYESGLDTRYRPRLRALRERFSNHRRCFIIGNGPSINKTDLSKLENEVTFAVNSFFLKAEELKWTPTFYVVEDHLVAEDRRDFIEAFNGPIKLFPVYLGYCFEESDDTIFFNHRPRISYPHGFDFSTDAEQITYTGCTVTSTCLQLAYYLGFSEIYLIGVDADYTLPSDVEKSKEYGVGVLDMNSDDPNHFHPDYFGKGFRWHDPQVDKMLEAYVEARRVVEENGRSILNATVGGKLEVFPRVSYDSLFENDEFNDRLPPPRTLLIDMTPFGGATATGELKKQYFADFGSESLLHLYAASMRHLALAPGGNAALASIFEGDDARIEECISKFDPEVVLYRPVADRIDLHTVAMRVIRERGCPWIIWLMDDWPERLRAQDEAQFTKMDSELRELLAGASRRFAISEGMAEEFGKRYGVVFQVFRNGVVTDNWIDLEKKDYLDDRIRMRYVGSLAPDTTRDSVHDVAKAIDCLAKRYPITLEIRTQVHWHRAEHDRYQGLNNVVVAISDLDEQAYRQWLVDADILILAYNFDASSTRYLQYSFANKTPEYLASGAAVLAYGPRDIATMRFLAENGAAVIVDQRDMDRLVRVIEDLVRDKVYREELGEKARVVAFSKLELNTQRKRLKAALCDAVKDYDSGQPNISWSVSAGETNIFQKYERYAHAYIDETELISALTECQEHRYHVMVDIGAHFGGSAAHFIGKNWKVFCFEPDPENRARLEHRIGDEADVIVDSRAVGEKTETEKPFFTSGQSTGISGLIPFHETHSQSGFVNVTTVSDIMVEYDLKQIDFLKIDVEGFDFAVLRGVPWDRFRPAIIECEFEDAKTVSLGHGWRDIAEYLVDKGYTVYVSEWHPVIQYGRRHDWHRLVRYPCDLRDPKAWGNLLAFREPIDEAELVSALHKVVKVDHSKSAKRLVPSTGSNMTVGHALDGKSGLMFSHQPDGRAFRVVLDENFTELSGNQWRYTHSGAAQKRWRAVFDMRGSTKGRSFVASVRLTSSRAMTVSISIARNGGSEYEGASKRVALIPGLEKNVRVSKDFTGSHAHLKVQVEVLELEDGGSADLTINSVLVHETLASIRRRTSDSELNVRVANRLFREGDYSTALGWYLQLYQRRSLKMYRDNAMMAVRRLGMDSEQIVEDVIQLVE